MKKNKWLVLIIIVLILVLIAVLVLPKLINKNVEVIPIQSENGNLTTSTLNQFSNYQRAQDAYSVDRAMSFLTELTSINPHDGWRSGGTIGESQAFDLVESKLTNMEWLTSQGMTVERENFHIFAATQHHTSSVVLTVGDKIAEVPADAPRGNRNRLNLTLQLDSDGNLTDTESDPIEVSGDVMWIPDAGTLQDLEGTSLVGKIALVNYSLVDSSISMELDSSEAVHMITGLHPSAIILYTEYSNVNGVSHGTYLGDGAGAFQVSEWDGRIPLLFIQIENLFDLGITNADQLATITRADVVWDIDVTNPATSTNLIVHIPGKNSENPVLLSAHLDSPNSPGALDDGSGSAILMEIVTLLNEQQIQPDADVYLVWFGSEEIMLYGSAYFTTAHSELVNQLQANIQVDALSSPVEGLPAEISFVFSNYVTSNVDDDPLAIYLNQQADDLGIQTVTRYWPFDSDNGCFSAFNISNLNMIYTSEDLELLFGGIWYGGHYHDPYDTIERAEEVKDVFEEMGKLALSAAFMPVMPGTGSQDNGSKQALFLANHTESPHMTPAGMPPLSWALIDAGYEVNVLPYDAELSAESLGGIDLVVIPPAYDYPISDEAAFGYDTFWTAEEAQIINDYAQNGGTVVVVNSAYRLSLYNRTTEFNEDWSDLNTLTDLWGIHFTDAGTYTYAVPADLDGTEVDILLSADATVRFSAPADAVIAGSSETAYLADLTVGNGKVIVVSDLTALGETYEGVPNPELLDWLAKQ